MNDPLLKLSQDKNTRVRHSLKQRRKSEKRFRLYGVLSIFSALSFLIILFIAIFSTGIGALKTTEIKMTFKINGEARLDSPRQLLRDALRSEFRSAQTRSERRKLYQFLSPESEYLLKEAIDKAQARTTQLTLWLPAGDAVNQYTKRKATMNDSLFSDREKSWYTQLEAQDRIRTSFNWYFFNNGDSRNPEVAGIAGAFMGSTFTIITALTLSFPIGVGAAIYLEEFAPKNKLTDIIEININNLAAVPSIVFGLLGLAIFLNVLGLPRSTPLVGGLVLTLMTLPTIIISSRASLKSVPPSIRDGALAMGASKTQVVFHHVVPLALPGMFTGSIIGMAQALGETAPLLMIGMVAFIVDIPQGFLDAATALPVQIFLWSENPERGFAELTSAAIMVLLFFLFLMNGVALYLRKKLERRW
ncbi:phosphate ABC transporter permease PstA [Vibrio sp. VGrn 2]|uniref:phosphate ABC transporter permease PstA n=1 Tax=Vibrio TaxID=662 RepID=UPI00128AEB92|nr:phosphate ABC transporter permease PstA [Vibrio sp. VGrn 2]EHD0129789.1 phosphate ABC transporter permease PstA [Vibrio alginolyticus]EJL6751080.1 phosphate ABC transporter permease PstA [Vibrio alginolyticus]MPS41738.1 phosphate ABC transporter permease PstA [Vibrio sp. VGrn 2]NAW94722.1 phosphate ABC transporter permease PstA [Vibrio sp. V42_P2S4T144]